jgi:hypothetical protein
MDVMQHNLLHVLQYFVRDGVATKWYQERSANGKQWCGLSEMMQRQESDRSIFYKKYIKIMY